jgi:hypothetical protein
MRPIIATFLLISALALFSAIRSSDAAFNGVLTRPDTARLTQYSVPSAGLRMANKRSVVFPPSVLRFDAKCEGAQTIFVYFGALYKLKYVKSASLNRCTFDLENKPAPEFEITSEDIIIANFSKSTVGEREITFLAKEL